MREQQVQPGHSWSEACRPWGREGGCLGPALTVQRNQGRLHTCVSENQVGSRKRLLDHMSGQHQSKRLFILINRQKRIPSQFLISLFLPSITECFPSSLLRIGKHKLWLTVVHLPRSINLFFSHHGGQHFLSPGHTIRSYLTAPVPRNLTYYILSLLLYYKRGSYSTKRWSHPSMLPIYRTGMKQMWKPRVRPLPVLPFRQKWNLILKAIQAP